jgi:hypothetical protein
MGGRIAASNLELRSQLQAWCVAVLHVPCAGRCVQSCSELWLTAKVQAHASNSIALLQGA